MTHTLNSRRRVAASMLTLLVLVACDGGSPRTPAIAESLAGPLVGTWNLTLTLERPLSLSTDTHTLPRSAAGTVALLEVGAEPLTFESMSAPTHMGVVHIDMAALGFPQRDAGVIPDVVARVVAIPHRNAATASRDSLYILFDPETPRYSIRLSGTFDANSASGVWIAESFMGGGGTFTMRRR